MFGKNPGIPPGPIPEVMNFNLRLGAIVLPVVFSNGIGFFKSIKLLVKPNLQAVTVIHFQIENN